MCGNVKPVDGSGKDLECACASGYIWVIFVRIQDRSYWTYGEVWGHIGGEITVFKTLAGGSVIGERLLGDMDQEITIRVMYPFKVCTREEIGVSHEANFHMLRY